MAALDSSTRLSGCVRQIMPLLPASAPAACWLPLGPCSCRSNRRSTPFASGAAVPLPATDSAVSSRSCCTASGMLSKCSSAVTATSTAACSGAEDARGECLFAKRRSDGRRRGQLAAAAMRRLMHAPPLVWPAWCSEDRHCAIAASRLAAGSPCVEVIAWNTAPTAACCTAL